MKNNINLMKNSLFMLVLSAALFAGCQKSDDDSTDSDQGKSKITFNLQIPRTFAIRTVGTGNENGGTTDKFAFYQFSKEGTYEQRYIFDYADAESVDESSNVRSYSFELTATSGDEKKFIIVESEDENNFPNMSKSNTIEDLMNSKTVAVNGQLIPPFVMSNSKKDDKAYVSVTNIQAAGKQIDVKLKRRVARFDLLNDPALSGLVIDKVYIKNRRTQGFIGDVNGNAGSVSTDVLEISANALTNGGKSFYLYPTQLTSTLEQDEKTVVWATTKLSNANVAGPTLYLDLSADVNIEANYLYQLNTKNIAGSAGFDISVEEWTDGTFIDWVTVENGISTMDKKAEIIKGAEIKGTYVKIATDATIPYIIKRVATDFNSADLKVLCDGNLPSWITVASSTTAAGNGLYRHEVVYTVTERPTNLYQFAVSYLDGGILDENLLVVGFTDPYPGTPLPCLLRGDKLYSPIHAQQTTYLTHNNIDKAYYCGSEGYVFDANMSSIKGNVAINPCPDGWSTLNDDEAKDYILWVGQNLKSQAAESVYTYRWIEPESGATNMRILAGYPTSKSPNLKDLAAFGTWPNVAWVNIKQSDLTIQDQTFGNQWSVKEKYGIPYRCIRDKAGWN